jgi:cytoskeletal protein RodZ
MSGPKPPGWEPEERDSDRELGDELNPASAPVPELGPLDSLYHSDEVAAIDQTGATDAYSRAYSAPESEHFTSPYVPAELYDYDNYDESERDERGAPRWPWVVGVAAILAAIALVVSVSLLVIRAGHTSNVANPSTSASTTPAQDEITTTTPPPSSPPSSPPTSSEAPTATETQTVTVTPTPTPTPVPAPATTTAPPPATSTAAAPPTTTTTLAGPRQVTYSVTGTKAPGDIISVTYVDASGRRRTQHNVYIPWSMTVTPISQSEVGSVEASSLFRLSRLNCSITTSDGTVLSANSNDAAQTSC